jgi:predicted helicase
MGSSEPFPSYLDEVRQKRATGVAKEHAYRGALERLLQETGNGIQAINDSAWVECGAPDYIVLRGGTPLGYVEAKDIDTSLDDAERTRQLKRYRESLSNLILTDYLEFRWYVEGEERGRARLASVTRDGKVKSTAGGLRAVAEVLERFFAQEAPMLGTAKELAQRMASLARMVRDLIQQAYQREDKEGRFHSQLAAFRDTLIPDLDHEQFADMYAQTITYGLFAARVRTPGGRQFTRQEAAWNLPPTNPFLRKLFNEIAGPDLAKEIAWAVDDLAHLLARADMSEVLKDFGKATRQEDPIVHFYETFLARYNPEMRQRRGVYYTPEPVVSYIVRSIDHLLKTRFNRPLGLADERVMILDPACGTGTFLYFVIQEIHDTVVKRIGEGAWNNYVREKLLGRIFGFELLMAPYAIAHLKLALQLQELGYDFGGEERLGIYLTNSLEEAITKAETLGFARFISEEADAASEIKRDKPIMVVLGNPPYSVSSFNKGPHIERLMERYKEAVRDERNIQPLSDDYIKFIRFAHDRIERTGYGIVGMITNHAYLFSLIHRGMRQELMTTFQRAEILNLHGNATIRERPPLGEADDNVFDIKQGVAISLLSKLRDDDGSAAVRYADLWGARQRKYRYLLEHGVTDTEWSDLHPTAPYWFFVPKQLDLSEESARALSLLSVFGSGDARRDQGKRWASGVKTNRDRLLVDFERDALEARIQTLAEATATDEEVKSVFGLVDGAYWNTSRERSKLRRAEWRRNVVRCLYRPFDPRWLLYQPDLIEIGRGGAAKGVMSHLLAQNVALVAGRAGHVVESPTWDLLFTSSQVTDTNVFRRGGGTVFPLYSYTEQGALEEFSTGRVYTRTSNLSAQCIASLRDKLLLDFIPDGKGDLESTFGPEDIFHYMYAVFHSPTYRERYAEFLKIDFPRLPLTSDLGLFRALAEKGEELVALHLMESRALDHLITTFPVTGSNQVEKVRYAEPGRGSTSTRPSTSRAWSLRCGSST